MSDSRYISKLTIIAGMFSVFLATIPSQIEGQTVQALNRASIARDQAQTAPGPTVTTNGEEGQIVASPNDPDLGEQQILKRTEGYQPFQVDVSVPFYWTSNVALTNRGEQSDFLVTPVVAIAYQPRIAKDISAYVSVREQLFYYDRLTAFNFGSFDAAVGLAYTIPQIYNLVLHLGYDYNRLTEKDSFDSFFTNNSIIVSAEIPYRINRAQQLFFGLDANMSMDGDPDEPRRHEFGGYVGYSVQLTRALFVTASGRITAHDYVLGDRVDVTELISLNATYAITKLISVNALASFAANQSNQSVFNYEVVNGGGAVSFSIRF